MAEINEGELVSSGALPPEDFNNHIERIGEIAEYDLLFDTEKFQSALSNTLNLSIDNDVISSIVAAIQTGNIVLQGPPGTGKSSLARAIAEAFNVSTTMVTAHDDWTTYDVIGRLELQLTEDQKEQVAPVNGCFTQTVINCANRIVQNFDDPVKPQAEWLIIDELNRAHLDKAFGELFTVLGTDDLVPVNLPHQPEGNRRLVIPRRFRLIATLNSYDRQFVNNLSQAIRRRFTFITIDIPPRKPDSTSWSVDPNSTIGSIRELTAIVDKASSKVARRLTTLDPDLFSEKKSELFEQLSSTYFGTIQKLMDLISSIRYSTTTDTPYLPIGTAQLIDTVELFLVQLLQCENITESTINKAMDWATSVKIVPLFEADAIDHETIFSLAKNLQVPFNKKTKRELLTIANAGLVFTPVD
jgi:MoxR-like ATPase